MFLEKNKKIVERYLYKNRKLEKKCYNITYIANDLEDKLFEN